MYKMESWYKLRGGRILVQITPLQDFGAEIGGGGGEDVFPPGWAYTLNITVHAISQCCLLSAILGFTWKRHYFA